MNLTLLIFCLISRNLPQISHNYSLNKKMQDMFSGYDQRYLINSTTTEICNTCNATILNTQVFFQRDKTTSEQLYNFKKMYTQLALLNYLNRDTESDANKISAIENYEKLFNDKPHPYKPNLLAGNLFKDWDTFIQ